MRFTRPEENEIKDWFYTFNSADIRLRKPFPKVKDVVGENYYPVVGGVFIKHLKESLQIFPSFPLGVGMVEDKDFELHLHRNHYFDDRLGLDSAMDDENPAQHEFLMMIGDINEKEIWKNYLSYKNPPVLFAVAGNEEDLSLDLERNPYRYDKWISNTEYSLSDENTCIYLSSLGINGESMYARVLNICPSPQEFFMNSTIIKDKLTINENPITVDSINIQTSNKIIFETNSNSGESVVRYPIEYFDNMISPYNFDALSIDHTCAVYHQIHREQEYSLQNMQEENSKQFLDNSSSEAYTTVLYITCIFFIVSIILSLLLIFIAEKTHRKNR